MTFKSNRWIRWLFELNGSILCFPYSPCQLLSVLIVFCQLFKYNNTSSRKKLLPARWVPDDTVEYSAGFLFDLRYTGQQQLTTDDYLRSGGVACV